MNAPQQDQRIQAIWVAAITLNVLSFGMVANYAGSFMYALAVWFVSSSIIMVNILMIFAVTRWLNRTDAEAPVSSHDR